MSELSEVEKKLSRQNDGRMANVILSNLGPILEGRVLNVLSKIRSCCRDGTADHIKLLALGVELCTLEDIENDLRQKINVADRITKEGLNVRDTDYDQTF